MEADASSVTSPMVTDALANASEYGAGTSVTITLGTPVFIVPRRLVPETFTADNLYSMLAAGTVRCCMAPTLDLSARETLDSAVASPALGFTQTGQRDVIKAQFEDDKVALFKVEKGNVVADQDAATATAAINPACITGEDLEARAALCTISKVEAGKLIVPRVISSDLRVAGPKTLAMQVSTSVRVWLMAAVRAGTAGL